MLDTVCACNKLRRSARVITAIYDETMSSSGFTVSQFSLLRMLQRAGPCSLTEFAGATGHDRTTLNRTLRPLEEAGYVTSCPGEDQRARIVKITDEARQAMRSAQPLWEEAQAKVDAALGADRDALFSILDRVESLRP
ncbi:MarR family winged helix-turn-helix transcriptional regulator [Sphingosinicella sp. LHD-64]|uniref:MarR family winged helix-turn-helix transcriptional regulator n=1 Tax=Sphingosinicella sp. LHD-64 TaxID=3072139 RepID=UPI00280E48A4|nr:MarR family winged helix-turn-helix transcriptional regulator [Sphingosinicella sp. LHD-64]MDQ8755166.1 MarR family winged helix-turn-helix transcriptional regulator [Sphingosinicella sp. LHD-64]